MTDHEQLAGYVDVWWQAVDDFTVVLEQVPAEQWTTPTDLPGWDVRAVAAHVAHLESVLAGHGEETADVGEPPHVTGPMGLYTEIGVVNRRDADPDVLINEIREVTTARHTQLLADPPTDGSARPPVIFAGVPWSWETLLRNRPLDVWMHEQDVRRAVGLPGGLDSAPAHHTVAYLAEGLGYVVAKRVGAAPGTTVSLELAGRVPVAFMVNDAGRGEQVASLASTPDVVLRTDPESYIVLAGGRRPVPPAALEISGDQDLGGRIVDNLATTP